MDKIPLPLSDLLIVWVAVHLRVVYTDPLNPIVQNVLPLFRGSELGIVGPDTRMVGELLN